MLPAIFDGNSDANQTMIRVGKINLVTESSGPGLGASLQVNHCVHTDCQMYDIKAILICPPTSRALKAARNELNEAVP